MNDTTTPAPGATHGRMPSTAALVGGAVLIAALGASAGWMIRASHNDAVPPQAVATVPSDVPGTAALPPPPPVAQNTVPAAVVPPPPVHTAPQRVARAPVHEGKPAPVRDARSGEGSYGSGGYDRPAPRPVAVCATCGTVEGVRTIQERGQGTGLGAVAGGVVGGLLGNQVGKGGGRNVATVLGAVGGGLAGHEVEKRVRSHTEYEVRVRMDDGSVRTVTQSTAPAPGARVVVENGQLRGASASSRGAGGNEPLLQTSDRGG